MSSIITSNFYWLIRYIRAFSVTLKHLRFRTNLNSRYFLETLIAYVFIFLFILKRSFLKLYSTLRRAQFISSFFNRCFFRRFRCLTPVFNGPWRFITNIGVSSSVFRPFWFRGNWVLWNIIRLNPKVSMVNIFFLFSLILFNKIHASLCIFRPI